jgi:hypothetical protein
MTTPTIQSLSATWTVIWIVLLSTSVVSIGCAVAVRADGAHVPLTISDGHEIGNNDYGRPVVLIAAALEVKPEVFREAFSGVTPARGGKPTPEQARRNKEALMKVLQPHGVTNDRLDEVSNYYRYRPQEGELWTHTPAKAHAVVVDGKIKEIVVTDGGSGYSSPPTITVKGFEGAHFDVELHFGKDLKTNGSIASITVAEPKKSTSSK